MINGLRKVIKDQTYLELLEDAAKVRLALEAVIALQEIPGVAKITKGYNPATWMLEVSSTLAEAHLNINFAEIYANSVLHR